MPTGGPRLAPLAAELAAELAGRSSFADRDVINGPRRRRMTIGPIGSREIRDPEGTTDSLGLLVSGWEDPCP